jgi:hypothetical protein
VLLLLLLLLLLLHHLRRSNQGLVVWVAYTLIRSRPRDYGCPPPELQCADECLCSDSRNL